MENPIRLERKFGAWNHQRSEVPNELEAVGVELHQWQQTCDKFEKFHRKPRWEHERDITRDSRKLSLLAVGFAFVVIGFFILAPLLLIGITLMIVSCFITEEQPGNDDQYRAFELALLVQNQQNIYTPYNIEISSDGPVWGPALIFSIDSNKKTRQNPYTPPTLAANLQSLHTLKQSGVLTDEEYANVAARVVSSKTPQQTSGAGEIPTNVDIPSNVVVIHTDLETDDDDVSSGV